MLAKGCDAIGGSGGSVEVVGDERCGHQLNEYGERWGETQVPAIATLKEVRQGGSVRSTRRRDVEIDVGRGVGFR